MKFVSADWLVTCDDNFTIIQNAAIAFDEKILDTGTLEELQIKYPNETITYLGKHSVIMPGLINAHVHLEFCANKTTLKYGNFVQWLFSVMQNREDLIEKATTELISKELTTMLKSGTTSIGAISSYGFDMEACIKSPLNVVYFTEVLGSKADMIDTLFADFQAKLKSAISNTSDNFIPAIAIHSAYSTHPFLIREVLNIAKEKHMAVSAHFQESKAENDWLNYSKGEFEPFFKDMLNQNTSLCKPDEFLKQFSGIKNLSFTHCVLANKNELEQIKNLNASIIHCPNSNRLLNNTILDIKNTKDISLALGTDGLSSNNSLNTFDEMRNAFFMHSSVDTNKLAKKLILSSTKAGAKALGLNKGVLEKNLDADFISFTLPDACSHEDELSTAIILHTTKTTHTYIKGIDELNK